MLRCALVRPLMISAIAASLLAGCAGGTSLDDLLGGFKDAFEGYHPDSGITKGEKTRLYLIGPGARPFESREELKAFLRLPNDSDGDLTLLMKECAPEPQTYYSWSAVPSLGVLAPKIISFVTDKIVGALEAEKKKYTASYSDRFSGTFYEYQDRTLQLHYPCMRLTRSIKDGTDTHVVASDIVAKFQLSPDGTALKVRPLRTYFRYAAARTRPDGKLSVIAQLKIDAVWRAKGEQSIEGTVAAPTLISSKIGLSDKPTYEKDPDAWSHSDWFKPVPVSTNCKSRCGNFALTATVSEFGSGGDAFVLAAKAARSLEAELQDVIKKSAK
jgi:hypothetical protein